MLKVLCQNSSTIVLNNTEPNKIVESVKERILNSGCENMTIDISRLSLIDACKVSILCSTEHYLKYPTGKINWVVTSSYVKQFSSNMNLGNSEYFLK